MSTQYVGSSVVEEGGEWRERGRGVEGEREGSEGREGGKEGIMPCTTITCPKHEYTNTCTLTPTHLHLSPSPQVCERLLRALMEWARTRDTRYLLAAQQDIIAVQNSEGDT